MTLYAIRHNATGNYLPQIMRGASHWIGAEQIEQPRLFTKAGAVNFVASWVRGPVEKVYVGDEQGHEGFGHYPIYDFVPKDVGRKKSDLSIIPVTLTYGEPL